MGEVILKDIVKKFGETVAVRDVNLDIKDGEFIVLVGPSGCGKSTTLRMVAGLEDPSSGEIYIGGKLVNDLQPKDRDIAMVFQSYALYPHMSVYENMAFGLKLRRYSKAEIDTRVKQAAEILGISQYLHRRPKQLSGGQRQRVALGRAIVREPQVFLLDEPLSNLDAKLRVQMRTEIKKLHARLATTIIYVTHDQVEAMTMGDRIVVMKDGTIQQVGTPAQVYRQPANMFVAGFIGSPPMNFLEVVAGADGQDLWLDGQSFKLKLSRVRDQMGQVAEGQKMVLGIRPEDLALDGAAADLTGAAGGEGARIQAEVEVVEPLGSETIVYCSCPPHSLTAKLGAEVALRPGDKVKLAVNLESVHLFAQDSGEALL